MDTQNINGVKFFADISGEIFFSAESISEKLWTPRTRKHNLNSGVKVYVEPRIDNLRKVIGDKSLTGDSFIDKMQAIKACLNTGTSNYNKDFKNWLVLSLIPAIDSEPKNLVVERIHPIKEVIKEKVVSKKIVWKEDSRQKLQKTNLRKKSAPNYSGKSYRDKIPLSFGLYCNDSYNKLYVSLQGSFSKVSSISSNSPYPFFLIGDIRIGVDFKEQEVIFYKKFMVDDIQYNA